MNCPRCAAPLRVDSAFCTNCGSPVTGVAAAAMTRPNLVTLLAVLQFIGAGVWFLAAAALTLAALFAPGSDTDPAVVAVIVAGAFAGAAYQLTCGIGLMKLKPYGRIMQFITAVIGLAGFPVGTIIAVLILIYINKPGIKLLFSGRPPESLSPEERGQIFAETQSSAATVVILVVGGVIFAVFVVGIIAAIAIPSLLRARMAANEAVAISTLRSVLTAERSYAASNQGFYDTPACLAAPDRCLPSYTGGAFLDAAVSRATFQKGGYDFTFTPGPAVDPEIIRTRGISPTSVVGIVVSALPSAPGATGSRSFCGDETGRLWSTNLGRLRAEMPQAACPDGWDPLDRPR